MWIIGSPHNMFLHAWTLGGRQSLYTWYEIDLPVIGRAGFWISATNGSTTIATIIQAVMGDLVGSRITGEMDKATLRLGRIKVLPKGVG